MVPITDVDIDRNDVPPALRAIYEQARGHATQGNWHRAAEAVALLRSGVTDSVPIAMLVSTILLQRGAQVFGAISAREGGTTAE